jgi:hypothetical protein
VDHWHPDRPSMKSKGAVQSQTRYRNSAVGSNDSNLGPTCVANFGTCIIYIYMQVYNYTSIKGMKSSQSRASRIPYKAISINNGDHTP